MNVAKTGNCEKVTSKEEILTRPSAEMILAEIFEKCGEYKKIKEIKQKYGY